MADIFGKGAREGEYSGNQFCNCEKTKTPILRGEFLHYTENDVRMTSSIYDCLLFHNIASIAHTILHLRSLLPATDLETEQVGTR
jgi:hypothetical protein